MEGAHSSHIADESSHCLELFKLVCRRISSATLPADGENPHLGVSGETMTDALSRFNVWMGNIGALKRGKSSLDYRLAHADVRLEVLRLLKQLRSSLSECGCHYEKVLSFLLTQCSKCSVGHRLGGAKAADMAFNGCPILFRKLQRRKF